MTNIELVDLLVWSYKQGFETAKMILVSTPLNEEDIKQQFLKILESRKETNGKEILPLS